MQNKIIVYGSTWCPDCVRAKHVLRRLQIDYEWITVESNPQACEFVKSKNNGNCSVPTILFPDGTWLTEPSNTELENRLKSYFKITG